MIAAKLLWITGSLIMGTLGTIHMIYTFFSDKFLPRDGKLAERMDKVSPVLSEQLTMWKAWIGFNGSHSSGIMFIAIINCFLAINYFPLLQKSHFYFLLNIVTLAFYVFLAGKYWFAKPLIGASITLACYVVAYVLVVVNR
ncbi:hypothetical protein KK083_18445 [Fulvivirgaceae bacterium PWU4]|uniref:Uncharacterized protein n=1 Tax=Chryseosolibacter histidini TaxID=2782349 RepID=A0AAP2DM59_9BACT|nr:hypothetical protein [Chryseosolibacter histidini]MBT1698880.1 hypothetical protein [Chryseosolibacter histidini]